MKNLLYDFKIYYKDEELDNIIEIDIDYIIKTRRFIKIDYIKDEKLVTIVDDDITNFKFIKRGPMVQRLEDMI